MHETDEYIFKPIEWVDDADGGAVGTFYGTRVELEVHNSNPMEWCICIGQDRYGYVRGGRDGERTLDDVKQIAFQDVCERKIIRYRQSKAFVEYFERTHIHSNGI